MGAAREVAFIEDASPYRLVPFRVLKLDERVQYGAEAMPIILAKLLTFQRLVAEWALGWVSPTLCSFRCHRAVQG